MFKGKYIFKEFQPPLDSSVVNEDARNLGHWLMEEEFLKIINDAWDMINGFNLHKKFRGG